jgi:hypothetical protein
VHSFFEFFIHIVLHLLTVKLFLCFLHQSLLEYYGSRDSARPRHSDIPHNRSTDTSGVLSDGSFEDLRD